VCSFHSALNATNSSKTFKWKYDLKNEGTQRYHSVEMFPQYNNFLLLLCIFSVNCIYWIMLWLLYMDGMTNIQLSSPRGKMESSISLYFYGTLYHPYSEALAAACGGASGRLLLTGQGKHKYLSDINQALLKYSSPPTITCTVQYLLLARAHSHDRKLLL
jgi:hypothetical protein